jgi:Outer membrane protein beta-barrel domain
MQRKVIVLLFFFASTPLAYADFFSMGPRIGVNISRARINSTSNNTATTGLEQVHPWGCHVGVFTRFKLLLCYAQPEILFTSLDAKFKSNNKMLRLSCTRLDIPAMVGVSLLRVFRVQVGPVFSWLLSAKEEEKYVREPCNSITTGWQAGIGIDIWRIIIDLKYETRRSTLEDKIIGTRIDYGYTPWMLSVGFNML